MPLRRRSALAALLALVPLSVLTTACGAVNDDWANRAKTAADSPVGNTGDPNVGITAEALWSRVSKANRDARGVHSVFSGEFYGVPVGGDTTITRNGDSESHLVLKDHVIRMVVVGGTEYTRLDPGTYAALYDIIRKAPGYDPAFEEPGDGFLEFGKLIEGKYLMTEDADTRGNGFPAFGGILGDGPFTSDGADDSDDSGDSDGSDGSDGSDEDDSGDDEDYEDYDSDTKLTLGDVTRVNGIEVIPLTATVKEDGDTSVTTMYVPAHGTPLPVRLTADEDNDGDIDSSMDTSYSAADGNKTVTAPPKQDTVDLEKVFKDFFGFGGSGGSGSSDDDSDDDSDQGSDLPFGPDSAYDDDDDEGGTVRL